MTGLVVRQATGDDVASVAALLRSAVAEGESYALPAELTDEQVHDLWLAPAGWHCVVGVVDGRIVGAAAAGPNRLGRGSHVATASFVVDPTCRGVGVGRTLGMWVLDWARRQGFAGIQFNAVVETNTAAVSLWRDLGFRIVGTVPGAFDSARHGRVGLHVMYREIRRAPDGGRRPGDSELNDLDDHEKVT